ncbi:hypothetical protein ABZW18_14960 [Streptomyces sp. NPDC004647]|uniref:hypothetical protein n=1 Tax=Streptomyces sp. NPDC004647 TaxID=3154671 RepID=UPI0033A7D085
MVYTPRVATTPGMTEAVRETRRGRSLLGTEGSGWDVGEAVAFLAGRRAGWITGVVLPVDTGSTAGREFAPNLALDRVPVSGNQQLEHRAGQPPGQGRYPRVGVRVDSGTRGVRVCVRVGFADPRAPQSTLSRLGLEARMAYCGCDERIHRGGRTPPDQAR